MKINRYVMLLIVAMTLSVAKESGAESGGKARSAGSKQDAAQRPANEVSEKFSDAKQRCEEVFNALNGNLWKNPETGSIFDIHLNKKNPNNIGIFDYSGFWVLTDKEGKQFTVNLEGHLSCVAPYYNIDLALIFPEGHPCAGDVISHHGDVLAGNRISLRFDKYNSVTKTCPDYRGDWMIYPFKPK